jgi:hypothetical protein
MSFLLKSHPMRPASGGNRDLGAQNRKVKPEIETGRAVV